MRDARERLRPASPAAVPADPPQETVADAIARYPELEHYADRPEKAVALACALDRYGDTERTMRRDVLGQRIAAEQAGRMPSGADCEREAVWHAEQMFASANANAHGCSGRAPAYTHEV